MAVEDRSLSEFPRALQVAEQALVMISNPDGLGGYDTNGAVLTEVGKALLNVQYTQQLGNVSVFDAIKNTRVLSGATTPLANEGANGQLYVKYQTVSDVDTVIGMYFKKDGTWLEISLGGGGGSSTLAGLSDVDITTPTGGQALIYDDVNDEWVNGDVSQVIVYPIAVTSQMVTASSTVGSNFEGYRAFDGQSCNLSTLQGGWLAGSGDNTPTLTVNFGEAKKLGRISIETANNNNPDTTRAVYIEGSSDGSTWENILASGSTVSLVFEVGKYNEYSFNLNEGEYQYFRIRGTQPFFGGSFQYACCFSEITIYDKSAGVVDIYPDAIADEYDSTQTYTADDYVMYGGKLYRCNHIGATGTWEPTWWDETSATDYTKSVNTALTTQINNIHDDTADAYSASSTYAVGDLCIAFGRLYRCTTAISTPEAWNSSHWAATTIADEIALKQDVLTMGSEVTVSNSNPFITYRIYGKMLFLYVNMQNKAVTTDETLANLPAECTPLMGTRVYRGNGLLSYDSENNNRLWARSLDSWTTVTMVLPLS